MAVTAQARELENSLAENAFAIRQSRQNMTGYVKDTNPDCARAQLISQCVDAGQLNVPPQQ